jgi:hypothetical protein
METFMERRDFLAQTATAVSAALLLGSFRSDRYNFVGSARAAGNSDAPKATLEQRFADFALDRQREAHLRRLEVASGERHGPQPIQLDRLRRKRHGRLARDEEPEGHEERSRQPFLAVHGRLVGVRGPTLRETTTEAVEFS